MNDYLLELAKPGFNTNNAPVSSDYDDLYCDDTLGIEEKLAVFVNANRLQERFDQLKSAGERGKFTLCELGFGFGINFGLVQQYWRQIDRADWQLHFVSIEKHPVDPSVLKKFYECANLKADWLGQYPTPVRGVHRIHLADNIHLTLIFDDITNSLNDLPDQVDAWFLDGFSPSKNADMWADPIYLRMAECSRPGATASTYSISAQVRHGLTRNGFDISRAEGFGRKRDMLLASAPGTWQPASRPTITVAIIGGGMAGLFSAEALQRRNIDCTIFDSLESPMEGASRISQYGVHPQIAWEANPFCRFSLSAFQYLGSHFSDLLRPCGFLRAPRDPADRDRQQMISNKFAPSPEVLTSTAQGLWFSTSGWIARSDLVKRFKHHSFRQMRITSLSSSAARWKLSSESEDTDPDKNSFDHVVIATGAYGQLLPLNPVPLNRMAGAALRFRHNIPIVSRHAMTLFPADETGWSTYGSTYQNVKHPLDQDLQKDRDALLTAMMSDDRLREATTDDIQIEHACRLVSRDRRPVIGAIPDWHNLNLPPQMRKSWEEENKHLKYQPGLWANTAYGSHGMNHSPLGGEYIASLILNEPLPISRAMVRDLTVERFLLRDHRKG